MGVVRVSGCAGCVVDCLSGGDDCGDDGEGGVDLEGELFGDVRAWTGVVVE